MTMALVYHSKKDDWSDDRDFGALMQTAVFRRSAAQVAESYPRQWAAITDGLCQLSEIEQRNLQEPDLPANIFGSILGELFLWKEDHWSNDLRRMGEALGRYIYLLDALLDLPADRLCLACINNEYPTPWGEKLAAEAFKLFEENPSSAEIQNGK